MAYFPQLSLVPCLNQETTSRAKHLLICPLVTFHFPIMHLYNSRILFPTLAPTFLSYLYPFFEIFGPKNSLISWVGTSLFVRLRNIHPLVAKPIFCTNQFMSWEIGSTLISYKKKIAAWQNAWKKNGSQNNKYVKKLKLKKEGHEKLLHSLQSR